MSNLIILLIILTLPKACDKERVTLVVSGFLTNFYVPLTLVDPTKNRIKGANSYAITEL